MKYFFAAAVRVESISDLPIYSWLAALLFILGTDKFFSLKVVRRREERLMERRGFYHPNLKHIINSLDHSHLLSSDLTLGNLALFGNRAHSITWYNVSPNQCWYSLLITKWHNRLFIRFPLCVCWHKSLLIYKTFLFLMGNKKFFNLRQITVKASLEWQQANTRWCDTQHYNLHTRDGEYDCYVSRAVTTILLTLDMLCIDLQAIELYLQSFIPSPSSLNFIIVKY